MARTQASSRPRGAAKPAKPVSATKTGTLVALVRGVASALGLALLAGFIGGLGGAHMALSTAPLAPAVFPTPIEVSSGPTGHDVDSHGFASVTVAVPVGDVPVTPEGVEDALARLYEEPPEAAQLLQSAVATADPGEIHLAALPAPGGMGTFVPARRPPLWLRNAVPVTVAPGQPMIAVVLDDLGLNRPAARRAIALPGPLTLSFMTYAEGLRGFAADARAAGHELLLHVPMEPRDPTYDPGPNALRIGLSRDEISRRLRWDLARFDGFVGINNHMGSKFTAAPEGIGQVMRELRARDLLFLDSVTSAASVAWRAAARSGVPFARRDVFLDHNRRDADSIRGQLARLERIAQRRGFAVGIGHPHKATLEVLADWLPEARRRGIALVPISAIVNHQTEVAHKAGGSAG